MISLGTILYLVARTLPRIDGEPSGKENILDRLANSEIPEKVDAVLNSFLGKFLRRLKILLMKVDNFVSERLKKISVNGDSSKAKIDFKDINEENKTEK